MRDTLKDYLLEMFNAYFNTNVTTHNPNSGNSVYERVCLPLISALTIMAFIASFGV